MKILKFGGKSLSNGEGINKVVSIITDKNSCLELDGSDGRIYRIIKDLSEDEIKTLRMIGHKRGHGSIESIT